MRSLYPDVMAWVDKQKERDYTELPKRMQRAESGFIFNKVCHRLLKELPGVWFATIHDSVASLPNDQSTVAKIMREEFAKLGVVPQLKRKEW